MNTANKSQKSILNWSLPFVLITVSLAAALFIPVEVGVLFVFIITLIIYALRKYDFRFLVGMGAFLLFLSASAFAWRGETYANIFAIPAFYFLATGAVGMLIDFMRTR